MFQHLTLDLAVDSLILMVSLFFLLRFCFLKKHTQSEHFISLFLFGVSVFLVTRLLHSIEISMGFAFGLFAIFSVLRYRTESLSTRDMTYLFTTITIALISSVSSLTSVELLIVNGGICVFAKLIEAQWFSKKYSEKLITYEVIENIKPHRRAHLFADLEQRTGLDVHDVIVEDINFMNDSAKLKVLYSIQSMGSENLKDSVPTNSHQSADAVVRYPSKKVS